MLKSILNMFLKSHRNTLRYVVCDLNYSSPSYHNTDLSILYHYQVQNGFQNPVAAAQNASANTDGATTEKAKNAAFAAGGAITASAGAAYVATKNTGARAVGAVAPASSTSNGQQDLSEKSHSDLQAEVKKLQAQVDSLKKGQSSDGGIPIHIVATICFGVFAFTYLFL